MSFVIISAGIAVLLLHDYQESPSQMYFKTIWKFQK